MANNRDLHNTLKYTFVGSAPEGASDNTALVGAIIDNLGFDALEFLITTGVLADADATFAVLLEDGDDSGLSDAADVVDAHMLGSELIAGFDKDLDSSVQTLGYIGDKRYVRLTLTPSANTGLWDASIAAIQRASLRPSTPPT